MAVTVLGPDMEQAQNFVRKIGSGKDADGYNDAKLASRPEIGNFRSKRRSRRGRGI